MSTTPMQIQAPSGQQGGFDGSALHVFGGDASPAGGDGGHTYVAGGLGATDGGVKLLNRRTGDTRDAVGWSNVPASAGASGVAGMVAYDSSYMYVCTTTNTWKRVAISTW